MDFISMSTLGRFGGFGNQLFQYAALKMYAEKNNLKAEVPEGWIGRSLFVNCNDPPLTQTPREQKVIEGKEPVWQNGGFGNCDIKGYFQYHTSFYDRDYFRSLYRLLPSLEKDLRKPLDQLRQGFLIGIHIRRGDYKIASRKANIAPTEWYLKWLKENWGKIKCPVLFIASDEIDNVIDDFKDYNPNAFRDGNFLCDFYILQHCDYLLTSNSTFSFTAAMLNEKGKFFRPDFRQKQLVSFDPWDSEPMLKPEIKLHLGCGGQHYKGYVNIDCIKTQATDLVCDVRRLPYKDNSVNVIETYHVIEHFPVCLQANVCEGYGEKYGDLIDVFKEWKRVLKEGGRLVIEVPDLDKVVEEYRTADEAKKEELLLSIYGSYRNKNEADYHRWGANEYRLRYMLEKAGYKDITFKEPQDYHVKDSPCLRVEAIK